MSAVFRLGFLLYVVTYIAMREILTHTTDLTWVANMALSVVVGIAVAAGGEALHSRLRADRAPAAQSAGAAPGSIPAGRAH